MKANNNTVRAAFVAAAAFVSLACFNILWISESGQYDVMPEPVMWIWMLAASLLVALPVVFSGRCLASGLIIAVADIGMVANLMYFNVFGVQIPLRVYRDVLNLAEFTDSLPSVMSPWMLLFPAILILLLLALRSFPRQKGPAHLRIYFASLGLALTATVIAFLYPVRADYRMAELRFTHNKFSTVTPLYSMAATWVSQLRDMAKTPGDADLRQVERFTASRRAMLPPLPAAGTPLRLIVVMLESMESWTIGARIGNREVTPALNRLIADTSHILYVPKVRPEVGAGRSSDAQLIVLCGLLPPEGEAYVFTRPGNSYPSLFTRFRDRRHARTALFTFDSPGTYNIGRMHKRLGFDRLYSRDYFPQLRKSNTKSDSLLLAKTGETLVTGWGSGTPGGALIVTYSCHVPFRFPNDMDVPPYPDTLPPKLARYLRVVSYTDAAIGRFVDSLRTDADFDRTLIVLTGDHNAFGRKEKAAFKAAIECVDTETYVPLVVINSPVAGLIGREVPQSDIYPTLLQLTGLVGPDVWPGVGRSFLGPYAPSDSDFILRREISRLVLDADLLR